MSPSPSSPSASPGGGGGDHDLFGYLESLPPHSLSRLYSHPTSGPYAARAALQRLPELARQYVLRLAVCGGEFPKSQVELWTSARGKKEASYCWKKMENLCVVERSRVRGDEDGDDDDDEDDGAAEEGSDGDKLNKKKADATVRLSPAYRDAIQKSLTALKSAPWDAITAEQRAALEKETAKQTAVDHHPSKAKKYPPPPTPDQLETYTQKRWDSVLHFLVGSSGPGVEYPPGAVVHFLEKTGLMQEDPEYRGRHKSDAPLVITSAGYEFMLLDVHVQVWQFILQYFRGFANHKKCEDIRSEALGFLICLSYCQVGRGYPASLLTKDSRVLMKDFSQFGLLYLCKMGGVTVFYPTRVAVNLVAGSLAETGSKGGSSGNGGGGGSASAGGGGGPSAAATRALEADLSSPKPGSSHIAVIVQTNFQLCAYTTSELHVSMLGLFCDVSTYRRLPNVIFYKITRDSVKGAFKLGIEAKQILRFLRMHAHPRLRTGDQPLIPSNVEDQILLWDRERRRVVMDEVYVHQCLSHEELTAVRQYATDHDGYGWCHEGKHKIMIKYDKVEVVMGFVRRWRARAAQRRALMEGEGKRKVPHVHRTSSYG